METPVKKKSSSKTSKTTSAVSPPTPPFRTTPVQTFKKLEKAEESDLDDPSRMPPPMPLFDDDTTQGARKKTFFPKK
jgi:hypothetical protein